MQEHLVLKADVTECQLIVRRGAGEQLHNVLFILELGTVITEQERGCNEQQVHEHLVLLEKMVYRQENPMHSVCFVLNTQR